MDYRAVRRSVPTPVGTVSRAKQEFRDECDVNVVVRNYAQTGMWSHLARRNPVYGDFSQAEDLRSAIALVEASRADFQALPAAVRRAVENDPAKFLEAMADPEQVVELARLGLPMVEGWKPPELEVPLEERVSALESRAAEPPAPAGG